MSLVRRAFRRLRHRSIGPDAPPLDGYPRACFPTPLLDLLDDRQLQELNDLLPWRAFTVDGRTRRLGRPAWKGKRVEPQTIPDPRIVLLHQELDLADKHVLEVGCFEGIHTIGLARLARSVTAIDSRVENVVKTIVRSAFYGSSPRVFPCNVEDRPLPLELLAADVVHHVGVLYHLVDPVRHLFDLGRIAGQAVMLDTHFALEHEATERYEVDGRSFRFKRFRESGRADPFSGMYPHAKWLRLADLTGLLAEAGLDRVRVVEERAERNGPRVLLIARRTLPLPSSDR